MNVIGLDIGGANLKFATNSGQAVSLPFPLWQRVDELGAVLRDTISEFPPADLVAVTMTGELADCFRTKAEGVDRILTAVENAVGHAPVFVWQTGAEFVSPATAREIPLLVAAANWHALATWCGRICPAGRCVMLDIGSTTSDFIPMLDGVPITRGFTDVERLTASELVYSGVRRTPIMSLVRTVPFRDDWVPLAAEMFATTLDVYLLLGDLPESDCCETANGQPATRAAAHDRLARNVCCDTTEFSMDDAVRLARFLANVHQDRLAGSLRRMIAADFLSSDDEESAVDQVIVSGSGVFLARRLVETQAALREARVTNLAECQSADVAAAACAVAVAQLASERLASSVLP